jgi:hypothetical protein
MNLQKDDALQTNAVSADAKPDIVLLLSVLPTLFRNMTERAVLKGKEKKKKDIQDDLIAV